MANCKKKSDGITCIGQSDYTRCKPWDLTKQDRTHCLMDGLVQEQLNIAGANLNVFKLLGVHEQTKLVDLTGKGKAISGGDLPSFPKENAFVAHKNEWLSKQKGSEDIIKSAFIGYDFGEIKMPDGRPRYAINTDIREHITTIKIKQSADEKNRILKARVERSDDCVNWYGVAIINLPNDNLLNTISFKHSAPMRYWRIRPIIFQGGDCDSWGVQALEMHDFQETDITNIQDKIFLDNRNRDYMQTPITIKGYYQLLTAATELLKYGIEAPGNTYAFSINFNTTIALLGRPFVIGDIIELPSESQYSPDLTLRKIYLEVNDVAWDTNTYTPGWIPTNLQITAIPALASEETQDIFGDLANTVDESGLFDNMKDDDPAGDPRGNWQDYTESTDTVKAKALDNTPERGAEGSNTIREFEPEEIAQGEIEGIGDALANMQFNRNGIYVEDGLPQNGEPYTEGPEFPQNPKNKDYHRLTYEGLAKDVPPRLYRYSEVKSRWVFLETDLRGLYDANKPVLREYTRSPDRIPADKLR